MVDLVLDTGALVALQRDQRRLRALVKLAQEESRILRTTAPVLTEFLGRSPRELRRAAAYVSSHLEASSVDETLARRAALLLRAVLDAGGRADPSAIDALVAAEAEDKTAAIVFEGDRADLIALAQASGVIELRELTELA